MQTLITTYSELETKQLGYTLSRRLVPGLLITLKGDLGAGKTMITRGIITGLGHGGAVQSPTFTLVEPYQFEHFTVYHFDLYRLDDEQELELIGFRDYLNKDSVCIVEWPQRAKTLLPPADIEIEISFADNPAQRNISLDCLSAQSVPLCEPL